MVIYEFILYYKLIINNFSNLNKYLIYNINLTFDIYYLINMLYNIFIKYK